MKALEVFDRAGHVSQEPPVWVGIAAALALGGGDRGRRAAVRGTVCYGIAALVANVMIKPFVRRRRPLGAGFRRPGPVTSSFPSGHAASDLAFSLGVAQELPWLFIPLSGATLAAHWSLVRTRGHHATDVLAGGAIGVGVAALVWRLWPPGRPDDTTGGPRSTPRPGEHTARSAGSP